MSNRYAPLPNPRSERDVNEEMEAAFDDSGDEDDDLHNTSESHPLNPQPTSPSDTQLHMQANVSHTRSNSGTYDFENVDYDYPPPGSPPLPSSVAQPNDFGNSNGFIPDFELGVSRPRRRWFSRTAAAVLPTKVAQRLGFAPHKPSGPVGGGLSNDGVFANVTAKPSRPRRVQEGDSVYEVPEDSRSDAPPSYATAQADAVPPYWETTVHAPFAPDVMGEMIIDSLPTGSLFSFLWNMLVSISFQFVGFLLTYLLHTTHAARLGSRAGLGVTLIQYGFALRGRVEGREDGGPYWNEWNGGGMPKPTGGLGQPGDGMGNSTTPTPTDDQGVSLMADATTEWLSFFLMTVGWFILLTSLLSFFRVKRWERGILASQRENNPSSSSENSPQHFNVLSQFERTFGLRRSDRLEIISQGFGLGNWRQQERETDVAVESQVRAIEEGRGHPRNNDDDSDSAGERRPMMPSDPHAQDMVRAAIVRDMRLRENLRQAGLV